TAARIARAGVDAGGTRRNNIVANLSQDGCAVAFNSRSPGFIGAKSGEHDFFSDLEKSVELASHRNGNSGKFRKRFFEDTIGPIDPLLIDVGIFGIDFAALGRDFETARRIAAFTKLEVID